MEKEAFDKLLNEKYTIEDKQQLLEKELQQNYKELQTSELQLQKIDQERVYLIDAIHDLQEASKRWVTQHSNIHKSLDSLDYNDSLLHERQIALDLNYQGLRQEQERNQVMLEEVTEKIQKIKEDRLVYEKTNDILKGKTSSSQLILTKLHYRSAEVSKRIKVVLEEMSMSTPRLKQEENKEELLILTDLLEELRTEQQDLKLQIQHYTNNMKQLKTQLKSQAIITSDCAAQWQALSSQSMELTEEKQSLELSEKSLLTQKQYLISLSKQSQDKHQHLDTQQENFLNGEKLYKEKIEHTQIQLEVQNEKKRQLGPLIVKLHSLNLDIKTRIEKSIKEKEKVIFELHQLQSQYNIDRTHVESYDSTSLNFGFNCDLNNLSNTFNSKLSASLICSRGGPFLSGRVTITSSLFLFEPTCPQPATLVIGNISIPPHIYSPEIQHSLCVDINDIKTCQIIRSEEDNNNNEYYYDDQHNPSQLKLDTSTLEIHFFNKFINRFIFDTKLDNDTLWEPLVWFYGSRIDIFFLLHSILFFKRNVNMITPAALHQQLTINHDDKKVDTCADLKQQDFIEGTSDIVAIHTLEELTNHLCLVPSRTWTLAFSSFRHGYSLDLLYKRVKDHPSVMLLQDSSSRLFGCFTTALWRPSHEYYGSSESCVFTWNPQLQIFRSSGRNALYIFCSSKYISIGAMRFALKLDHNLLHGSSEECETFSSPCLASSTSFMCQSLEVWTCQ